jgi:hypothetical protein
MQHLFVTEAEESRLSDLNGPNIQRTTQVICCTGVCY